MLRVLIVNDDGDTERLCKALQKVRVSGGCICPVNEPNVEKVLMHLDVVVHGSYAEYDVVVIQLKDTALVESIACAVINKIPWQTVIIVGKGPLPNPTYAVSFVSNILGVIAEMTRMKLIA